MAHSNATRFSIYEDFNPRLKSIATQCCMMQGLYFANDFSNAPTTLRQFVFARHKEYVEKLSNNQFYSESGKRALIRDCETLRKSVRSGYWRQRLAGRPVRGTIKFAQLARMVGWNSRVCIHPLFRLLNDFELLTAAPHRLTSALSSAAVNWLLKKPNTTYYLFSEIPQAWKDSYRQQRQKIVSHNSLDSFTVLALQTIYHQHFLRNKASNFKQLLWQHFETLFCYRYPLKDICYLADKVEELLRYYNSNNNCEMFAEADSSFAHFKKQLKDRQLIAYPNLDAVVLSSKRLEQTLRKQTPINLSTIH